MKYIFSFSFLFLQSFSSVLGSRFESQNSFWAHELELNLVNQTYVFRSKPTLRVEPPPFSWVLMLPTQMNESIHYQFLSSLASCRGILAVLIPTTPLGSITSVCCTQQTWWPRNCLFIDMVNRAHRNHGNWYTCSGYKCIGNTFIFVLVWNNE